MLSTLSKASVLAANNKRAHATRTAQHYAAIHLTFAGGSRPSVVFGLHIRLFCVGGDKRALSMRGGAAALFVGLR